MRAPSDVPFADLLRVVDLMLNAPAIGEDRAHTDLVSDLLGFLGQRMTEPHAQRQQETRQFLTWLETKLETPIDKLAGKMLVQQYWTQASGIDTLLDTIERNRPRVTALDVRVPGRYGARNQAREEVIDAYETSMRRLRPMLTQIEITDRLIDQLVYRLYDMRPEEIALVESHFDGARVRAGSTDVS